MKSDGVIPICLTQVPTNGIFAAAFGTVRASTPYCRNLPCSRAYLNLLGAQASQAGLASLNSLQLRGVARFGLTSRIECIVTLSPLTTLFQI